LRRECSYTPSGSSSMTVRALEVQLPYAPSKRRDPAQITATDRGSRPSSQVTQPIRPKPRSASPPTSSACR
jgi:hypothetical protein